MQDLVRFAWRAMSDRKLRTTLTIIGIVIGPATIVALLSVTGGFSNAVTGAFAKTGTTSIFVSPAQRGAFLTYNDLPTMEKMPGVSTVIPFWLLTGTVTQGTQTTTVQLMAADFSKLSAFLPGLSLTAGTEPTSNDLTGADIGWSIAHPGISGAANITVNQVVTISISSFGVSGASGTTEQKSFIVRGIFGKFGQGIFVNPDTSIFVPLSEGQSILHTDHYSGIVVVASSASTVNQVVNELENQYGQSVRVTSITSIVSTIQSITSGIGTILGAVGGISVIVAFVGIMTTMFTTIVERTKEIGILKALGYTSRNVMLIFLVEATLTGLLGGVIGAGGGVAAAFVLVRIFSGIGGGGGPTTATTAARGSTARFQSVGGSGLFGGGGTSSGFSTLTITPAITPELLLLAIALATAVGALAGLLPSWRASRLLPVEALYSQ